MLNSGVLPQHFITRSKIKGAFRFFGKIVKEHSNLTALIHDPDYYYINWDFKVFRHVNLLIVLHVSLTMQHLTLPFELIKVQRIPLYLPHDDVVIVPSWQMSFAIFYTTKKIQGETRCETICYLDLADTNAKLLNARILSVALALLKGDFAVIKPLLCFSHQSLLSLSKSEYNKKSPTATFCREN